MRHVLPLAAILTLFLAGCAATKTEAPEPPVEDLALSYPKAIYVYDFAVAPAEVPYGSAAVPRLSGATDDPDKNEQRDKLEREIADALAGQVVAKLQALGLPAVRWRGTPPLNDDAYVVEGQFLTLGAGGEKIIGLSLGGAELRVLAQAYRVDGKRRKPLGEADVGADTAQAPGLAAALPMVKLSATRAAASLATGAGAVRSVTSKVRKGAEDTAQAIVDLLKPSMEAAGWALTPAS